MQTSIDKLMLIITSALLFPILVLSQNITVSGYITIAKSGESLINATIFDSKTNKGTVSNTYGFYSLTLPKGETELHFSYIGLSTEKKIFTLSHDTIINIKLSEENNLTEVTVIGYQKGLNIRSSQMSVLNIPVTQIKNIPALLGETDVIKALQLMPGVKGGSEGSAGLYVRGGGPDENLLLLDGVPVYNVNHLFGFFSVFNADAIKDVTLYKGNFPARFGGRLSSVIDIRMNDGNDNEIHGIASIGLISSKINLEGPIVKGKTTFNFSARRTYADMVASPFIEKYAASQNGGVKGSSFGYYFYDINGKISHKISDNDRLYLSTYLGDDVVYGDMQQYEYNNGNGGIEIGRLKLDWDWGNLITALRWNHIVSNKLFMNTTASFTQYRFDMSKATETTNRTENPASISTNERKIGFNSGISDYTLKVDFDWLPNPHHSVKFGANFTRHSFRPGVSVLQQIAKDSMIQKMDTTFGDKPIDSDEFSAYVEDNISINHRMEINVGLHYSGFLVQNRLYNFMPQPRIGIRFLINDKVSIKTAYASMNQYIHLLSNSSISLPSDLWVPVTKRIPPMQSSQYSAGIFYNFKDILNLSIEGYYKTMNNLVEYKDGASFLGSSTGWEDKVSIGKGSAYGIEFLAQKNVGKTTGWFGYTWARSKRLFNLAGHRINNGIEFPAKYDVPHSLSIVLMHKFSNKVDIAGTWILNSGNRGTLALQYFDGTQLPQTHLDYNINGKNELPYINSRNNYRLGSNHRLDLGVNFHKQKKHGVRTWNISIYNVYNHMNPFLVTITHEQLYDPTGQRSVFKKNLTQTTLFPVMPSVSYSYKF